MKKTLIIPKENLDFNPIKIIAINNIKVIDDKGVKLKIEFELKDGK
jgi:hypothetical protein